MALGHRDGCSLGVSLGPTCLGLFVIVIWRNCTASPAAVVFHFGAGTPPVSIIFIGERRGYLGQYVFLWCITVVGIFLYAGVDHAVMDTAHQDGHQPIESFSRFECGDWAIVRAQNE